jgi:large subunit ribosomal protein L29
MQAKKIRELGDDELRQKRGELIDASFHLRLRRATGQLENPMKVRQTKRDLARVLTVLGERARAAHGAE